MSFASVLGPFSADAQDDSNALLFLVLKALGPLSTMTRVSCASPMLRDLELQWRASLIHNEVKAVFTADDERKLLELLRCPSPDITFLVYKALRSHLSPALKHFVHDADDTDRRGRMYGLALERVYVLDLALAQVLDRNDARYKTVGEPDFELLRRAFRAPAGGFEQFVPQDGIFRPLDPYAITLFFIMLEEGIRGVGRLADYPVLVAPIPNFDASRAFVRDCRDGVVEWVIEGSDPFVQWVAATQPHAASVVLPHLLSKYLEWLDRGDTWRHVTQLWDDDRHDWMLPAKKVVVLQQAVAARGVAAGEVDEAVAAILRQYPRCA